jgi:hypothetical protein
MIKRPIRNGGALPFSYIEGLYTALSSCPLVRFKTFSDLPFNFDAETPNEKSMANLFKVEHRAWKESAKNDPKLDIIIMHDCDSGPSETNYICEYERLNGIKSTTSLFVRTAKASGLEPYPIDLKALAESQSDGLCFSYHCNAWETSGYKEELLQDLCNDDVRVLKNNGLNIRHFSPHGGIPSPDGRNNNSFFYPRLFNDRLIWTHNRFAPTGDHYSDGSFLQRLNRGVPGTDLLRFLVEYSKIPNRIFILIHPQYYFAESPERSAGALKATPWLEHFWKLHAQGQAEKYWEPLVKRLDRLRNLKAPFRAIDATLRNVRSPIWKIRNMA